MLTAQVHPFCQQTRISAVFKFGSPPLSFLVLPSTDSTINDYKHWSEFLLGSMTWAIDRDPQRSVTSRVTSNLVTDHNDEVSVPLEAMLRTLDKRYTVLSPQTCGRTSKRHTLQKHLPKCQLLPDRPKSDVTIRQYLIWRGMCNSDTLTLLTTIIYHTDVQNTPRSRIILLVFS